MTISKNKKQDFRNTLNFLLGVFYERQMHTFIHKEPKVQSSSFSFAEISDGVEMLIKDGYVKQVAAEYSQLPLAGITGKGRIFYEQGGYQDETTRLDKMIRWAKNHKVLAWVMLVYIVLASVAGTTLAIVQLVKLFR